MPRPAALQSQEVAVDWQEPMVRERNAAATAHTTAPINHTKPSPRNSQTPLVRFVVDLLRNKWRRFGVGVAPKFPISGVIWLTVLRST